MGLVKHEQKHFNGPLVGGDGGKKNKNNNNNKTQEILKQPHIEIVVAF